MDEGEEDANGMIIPREVKVFPAGDLSADICVRLKLSVQNEVIGKDTVLQKVMQGGLMYVIVRAMGSRVGLNYWLEALSQNRLI
jgi:hypothetical protein